MKIENILAHYFYANKQLTLQGIGTFTLSPDFVLPAENDKGAAVIPQGSIIFKQDSKATEDGALIDFIVQQTRKMKPLASSDLESFIGLGTQFLNIGKPFKIEGVGMLEKNQLGQYNFTQYGQMPAPKTEDTSVHIREKADENISFATEERSSNSGTGKKIAGILAAVVVLGGIAWAAWYFLLNKKNTAPEVTQKQPAALIPVASTDTAKKDTALVSKMPDSVAPQPTNTITTPANGSYNFKIVIKQYPTLIQAQKAYARLTMYGHKVLMYTTDSVLYKIAITFNQPLSDTTYAKDSLRKFFNAKAMVELH